MTATFQMTADQAGLFAARLRKAAPSAQISFVDGALHVDDGAAAAAQSLLAQGLGDTKDELKAYAAAVRYDKEVGGFTVSGVAYPTDRETQAKLTGAYALAQVNPSILVDWKLPGGGFTTLDAAAITAVASAVGIFVQQCFSVEAAVGVDIDSGAITTRAQIDARFAA